MRMSIRILALVLLMPLVSMAAEEVELRHAPIDPDDFISLQRGARTFMNYCYGCHSLHFMRYNRLHDIGLTDDQIRKNLIFTDDKVGALITNAMPPDRAKAWFGAAPPDLSVIARARSSESGSGVDWLYTYLLSFYRDPSRPTGWNNTVFPNVSMPHVLWQLQGEQALKTETVEGPGYPIEIQKLVLEKKGTLSPVEYERTVADLVNFLDYVGEPARQTRTTVGIYVLLFLAFFWVLAFFLKKEFWKDVH